MHITLRQLEVFAEVLKSGSTTQASQRLALSQSAVSAALADLEGQLGVQLLDRIGKRLLVNEHGRLLYPRVLGLLEQAKDIEQLFLEDNGFIRLYASSTIGNYILPEIIAGYCQDFPELPFELSVGNSQDVIHAVSDFRVDIGLIEGPCHVSDIVSEVWQEDELVVFSAPANPFLKQPVTLDSLASQPWILREQGSGTREIVDYLLLSSLPQFRLGMELGNSEAIKHAVRHGMGISCLSRRVIAEQLESGSLVRSATPAAVINTHIILHSPSPEAYFKITGALSRYCKKEGDIAES